METSSCPRIFALFISEDQVSHKNMAVDHAHSVSKNLKKMTIHTQANAVKAIQSYMIVTPVQTVIRKTDIAPPVRLFSLSINGENDYIFVFVAYMFFELYHTILSHLYLIIFNFKNVVCLNFFLK